MYLILVGAGALGNCLIQIALQKGHDVALIERDEQLAQQVLQEHDVLVFHADIVQSDILQEARADKANALIATTDDDAINLMTMFLGVEHEIKTLISVVNQPRHEGMFERLGVHVLVDPEALIAHHLYKFLLTSRPEDTAMLSSGETLFEVTLTEDSPLIDQTLTEALQNDLISSNMLVVLLKRDGKTILSPSEDTTFHASDQLVIFSQMPLSASEFQSFTG
jgi:trk system potassium uptake protein TrkA